MEFLVLAPPVCTPSEPPSGAFVLAGRLAGHGRETGMLDLSLELYHRVLEQVEPGKRTMRTALSYLLESREGYDPNRHRSACGALHGRLGRFGRRWPGWKLTLMDIVPPWPQYLPLSLARGLAHGESPFENLWEEVLWPVVEANRPRNVLVSLAYLSQLPAAIDLVRFLEARGVFPIVGGSLPRSLESTGHGLDTLARCFRRMDTSDGSSLLGDDARSSFSAALSWPALLSSREYISARPIIPIALSTGCFWGRCLFCPDRRSALVPTPIDAVDRFLSSIPKDVARRGPVVHLLDSAVPPALLARFCPLATKHRVGFYGFARPDARLAADGLLEKAAASGCLMLQLGVESGSARLLERFDKGLDPAISAAVMRAAAAAGIRVYAYLLFGLPGETDDDRAATAALLEACEGCVDFLNLSLFNLPYDCELSWRAEEFGIEAGSFSNDPDGLRLYRPFTCGGEDTRANARRFVRDDLLAREAIRAMHLRTPKWFRAAHLAIMNIDGRRSPAFPSHRLTGEHTGG